MIKWFASLGLAIVLIFPSCKSEKHASLSAQDILGNKDYPAIAYGGYRNQDRSKAPSIADIKEDLKILDAAGFKILRTYHARLYQHTPRLLQAISEVKEADPSFEMYVMLGAWIQCENAFSENPDHTKGDTLNNKAEIVQAIALAKQYPDIVKVIAVGNESMVHWAATYYVEPDIILHWVEHLQSLKGAGELDAELWITSSDNFASWGGGDDSYYKEDLEKLIRAVDYVSLHSYPFHDTHYDPEFWYVPGNEEPLDTIKQVENAIARCVSRVKNQYVAVESYMYSLGIEKDIHIGETGWASYTNTMYGTEGSHAADEFKQTLYYEALHEWTNSAGISCFYFEAFDEPWKDDKNPGGSENHFGLFGVNGKVKMPLWGKYDAGSFTDLYRNGKELHKSYAGERDSILKDLLAPPYKSDMPVKEINYPEQDSAALMALKLIIVDASGVKQETLSYRYPTSSLKLEGWENTCRIELIHDSILLVQTGTGSWWGGALSYASGEGQNHSDFKNGTLHISVRGNSQSNFELGLQSGSYSKGNLKEGHFTFGPNSGHIVTTEWQSFHLDLAKLTGELNWEDIGALLYLKGLDNFDGANLEFNEIYLQKPEV